MVGIFYSKSISIIETTFENEFYEISRLFPSFNKIRTNKNWTEKNSSKKHENELIEKTIK
jgi:hypothetical protein